MSYHQPPNIAEILQDDTVGKFRKIIGLKYFLNRECNCNSTTKVKVTCAYIYEFRVCFVGYKFMRIQCILVYAGNNKIT